jgi:hypothetical protein
MLSMQIGGKTVNPANSGEVGAALKAALVENVQTQIRAALSAVRDPVTGEFAVVSIRGDDLENMTVSVEGSDAVKELAMARLREFGVSHRTEDTMSESQPIYAFLSHAGADIELADRLARDLTAQGIEVFLDRWDITYGDSIPGKINDALATTTHFLVLLSPDSEGNRWVRTEMDAGLMDRVDGRCKFIAIRHGVPAANLPPLIRPWASPSLDDYDAAVSQLVSDIHGISRRPPLGPVPAVVDSARETQSGLSAAAFAIARLFIEKSQHGLTHDPMFRPEQFLEALALTDEDIRDGVHELEGRSLVKVLRAMDAHPAARAVGFHVIGPTPELFTEYDEYVMPWKPPEDAQRVAADLVNGIIDGNVGKIAEQYGWEPRRLNPAITYLISRHLVLSSKALGAHNWASPWIQKTDETRRFVKSR